jgi:site-specific DNA recombinase
VFEQSRTIQWLDAAGNMQPPPQRRHCVLDFIEMKNDDSPEGRLQFNIMASMAEYMGEKIVERGKDGRQRMLEDGRIPGGVPVYGHDLHPTEKGRRVINEFEAQVAREMYEHSRRGKSCYAIAAMYNERGIRSKGRNGEPPASWSRTTVLQLLTNRAYIGEHRTGDTVLPVPRIVSDELFFAVQAQLEKNGRRWVGRPSHDKYLFTNFLHCDKCQHRMTGKNRGRNYVCGHRTNKPPIRQLCHAPRVRAALIDAIGWAAIWEMLKDPAQLLTQARAYFESLPKPDRSGQGVEMQQELAKLKRQRDNRLKMYRSGEEEYDEKARAEMLEIKRRIAFLEAELSAIDPVIELPEEHVVEAYSREITEGEEPLTHERRRPILESLDELRIGYVDGEMTITGKVPVGANRTVSNTYKGQNCYRSLDADAESQGAPPFKNKLFFFLPGGSVRARRGTTRPPRSSTPP